ncbi:hypothetical protein JCM19241_4825 [Vibrio ishigakensis]|uniref:Uncharacterized protein n=1 Tax=Vibrio ishigakensis TaxID=1481914 RepID=A0A0B8QEP1_9VIBR|nr:hypothetical protein JCM19241_4825 [Vibrio ishigakensis]
MEAMFTEYAKQAMQEKLINCRTFEDDEERTEQEREKVRRKYEPELKRKINRARRLCWLGGITSQKMPIVNVR